MKDGRNSRRDWLAFAAIVAAVVGGSAWWGSRIERPAAVAPEPAVKAVEPEEPTRPADRVTGNYFGRVESVQHGFFAMGGQPCVGIVLSFADGRAVAFACHPSQFGSVAALVGRDAKILVGERAGVRDWLISAGDR